MPARLAHTRLSRRQTLRCVAAGGLLGAGLATLARAQGVDLAFAQLERQEGWLSLSFDVRLSLPRAVEVALLHGVPMYFSAQATVYRNRWYWRDERVARVSRTWRLAYQPLTSTWRVSLGGFSQTYNALAEALAAVSRATRWRLAEQQQLEADSRHYVEFSYRLDTQLLPGPMQIGLAGQGEWQLGIERTLRVDGP